VVQVLRLSRPAAGLEGLNPALPPGAITATVDELTRGRGIAGLLRLVSELVALSPAGEVVTVSANRKTT
jgi:hypothetical protein